jgi:hypothetical protein
MSEEQRAQKRPKGRSPAYPAISLEKAIQRVRQLYIRDKQYAIPVSSLPDIWGYNSLNGPASLTISALKKFGLVNDEGAKDERRIKVTDSAVHILNHPSSDARAEAIRNAALLPPIHRELWEAYGASLPSDANLEWRLTRERGFTETGAKEFIREWRETMEFAGIDDRNQPDSSIGASEPEGDDGKTDALRTQAEPLAVAAPSLPIDSEQAPSGSQPYADAQPTSSVQSYPIPIALHGRPPVVISGAFPLSEPEWAQFKAVLDAMRPVLVSDQSGGAGAKP